MLTIDQLSNYFPLPLRRKNPQGVLVEYLQHEILDSIFKEKASAALSFIGGTAIRILCKVKITNSGDQKKQGYLAYANYHL